MRVYYDDDRDCLFVQGTMSVYPPMSLEHSDTGTYITVSIANGERDVAYRPWDQFAARSGTAFSSIAAVRTYLDDEFSKAPSAANGVPSGGSVNQVLRKSGTASFVTAWVDIDSLISIGGSGTTVEFFQVQDDGTTGQLTTGAATVLAGLWDTPTIEDSSAFAFVGLTGTLTVLKAGVVEFDIKVTSHNNANNRHELHVQLLKNGTTVLVEDSQYASRNNTQDEGSAYIVGFKDECSAADTYQIRVFDVGVPATVGNANVAGQTYISAKLYT